MHELHRLAQSRIRFEHAHEPPGIDLRREQVLWQEGNAHAAHGRLQLRQRVVSNEPGVAPGLGDMPPPKDIVVSEAQTVMPRKIGRLTRHAAPREIIRRCARHVRYTAQRMRNQSRFGIPPAWKAA